ncbi:hypothetical protein LCL95_18560 [Bacillus timonensis]|nr:hypothetical protein [Bacillus timonensis]
MSKIIDYLNINNWSDWSLIKIEIDYNRILIIIGINNETYIVKISCQDYIGISYIGHWDESILDDIEVEKKGSLIDKSLKKVENLYGENPLPGGGTKKIEDNWFQINIKLIDGNTVKVVCKNIELVEGNGVLK